MEICKGENMSRNSDKDKSTKINNEVEEDKIKEKDVSDYIEEYNKIKNENYKNIAFMGPYGAGKSFILNKIKNQDPKRYININMIEFSEDAEKESSENKKSLDGKGNDNQDILKYSRDEKIRKVESSIIQQLIYQEPQKKIPFSKIKKEYPDKKHLSLKIISIIVFIALVSCFSLFNCFHYVYNFSNTWGSWLSLTYFVLILLYGGWLLYSFIYYCYINFRISKIKYEKNNYSIECEKYESVYNQFLDEIIYFFKYTTYNTIIFEDIDRYNDLLFFSHLRELNSLLNNSKYLNKKITFIYAIRDDLFRKQDKNKFFDYIIPVIPIMDYSNSLSYFNDKFHSKEDGSNTGEIKENTLKSLSYYISDLRTLRNIFHEYDFYKKLASSNIYSNDNLLAIVVFKNLYPSEFAKLQYNDGIIVKIFNEKENIINSIIEEKEKKYKKYTSFLKEKRYAFDPKWTLLGILKEFIEDKRKEFRSYNTHVELNGTDISIYNSNDLFNREFDWGTLKEIKSITFETAPHDSIELPIYIKEQIKILDALHQDKDFIQNKTKQEIIDSIDEIQYQINEYYNIKANKLYQEEKYNKKLDNMLDEYSKTMDQKDKDKFNSLVKSLITNGLIDESYSHYISLTFDKIISDNDLSFIRKVNSGIKNEFNSKLDNIEYIAKELKNNLYDNEYSFNLDVIKYLARTNCRNLDKLLGNNIESLDLVYQYLDCKDVSFDIIGKSLCKKTKKIVEWISNEKDEYKKSCWIRVVILLDNNIFNNLEMNDSILKEISNFDLIKLTKISSKQIENLIKNLESRDIKFSNIIGCEQNKDLFDEIIKHNLFEINYDNIQLLDNTFNYYELINKYGLSDYLAENIDKFLSVLVNNNINTLQVADFYNLILTKSKNKDLVCSYLKNNVQEIKNIDTLLPLDENIIKALCKNQNNIIKFLNSSKITKDQKIDILKDNKILIDNSNVSEFYKVINNYKLFDENLLLKQLYDNIMDNLIEQSDKNELLIEVLPIINDKNNLMRILKIYNRDFAKTKNPFDIEKNRLNDLIVNKLRDFNLYEIKELEDKYELKKIPETPKLT